MQAQWKCTHFERISMFNKMSFSSKEGDWTFEAFLTHLSRPDKRRGPKAQQSPWPEDEARISQFSSVDSFRNTRKIRPLVHFQAIVTVRANYRSYSNCVDIVQGLQVAGVPCRNAHATSRQRYSVRTVLFDTPSQVYPRDFLGLVNTPILPDSRVMP